MVNGSSVSSVIVGLSDRLVNNDTNAVVLGGAEKSRSTVLSAPRICRANFSELLPALMCKITGLRSGRFLGMGIAIGNFRN